MAENTAMGVLKKFLLKHGEAALHHDCLFTLHDCSSRGNMLNDRLASSVVLADDELCIYVSLYRSELQGTNREVARVWGGMTLYRVRQLEALPGSRNAIRKSK